MQQQIQLNIIPFKPVSQKLTFAFYGEKRPDTINASIKWDKLFDEFPEDRDPAQKSYFSDFRSSGDGAFIKEIDVFDAINFTQKYYRYQILQYFKNKEGIIVFPNFIDDVEVWIEDHSITHEDYRRYFKFSLKIQYKSVTEGYELQIAYDGKSRVARKSLDELPDTDPDLFKNIICNGIIYRYQKEDNNIPGSLETQFPILNYGLAKALLGEKETRKFENQYPIYQSLIKRFFTLYINVPDFKEILNISEKGFHNVAYNSVYYVNPESNKLKFKEGENVNPGYGISTHKPAVTINSGQYKIFFIHHADDADLIDRTIIKYIKYGWHQPVNGVQKHSKSLHSFIDHNIFIDDTKKIVFSDTNNLYEEVSEKVKSFTKAPYTTYIAVFVSPISKLDKDHPQHKAYYLLKEQLLYKGITSQVLYKENLAKDDFYYFLPNIYVAMLAKLGGIPWRLAEDPEDDIIIGIGAFKPQDSPHRYVGSAFCFSNKGIFEAFNCFREKETTMLAGAIRNAVIGFKEKKQNLKRIIIHFYKEISDEMELKPILNMLDDLGESDTPVIVVTVNKTESKELMGFDVKSPGLMPISGSHIKVGYNKYLLFNNTRYFGTEGDLHPREYHFPIKLTIRSSKKEMVEDLELVKQLVNQVYQFSRMYWKSISQQNIPVTTAYPEMVAKIYPHFENHSLTEFGQKNLWFL
jgi:hypothetical protein